MQESLPDRASVQQTAGYLGVSVKTVRNYIASGRLTAIRIGPRLLRIERESIERLLQPVEIDGAQ